LTNEEARHFLTGPVMSLRTPFDADGEIDFDGVRRIIDVSLDGGSRTIMLTAGDSHYNCLSDDEISELTRVSCEHTAGRAMVIAADRYHSTARAIEFAMLCRGYGADMFMALPPDWGASCTPKTLARHYAAVAEVMPVMLVTNIFIPRGAKFGLETIERSLDSSPNIVAIKDDMCGVFAQDMCARFSDRVAIIAGGMKRNHMDMWPYGCDGYLSTLVMFNAAVSQAYWHAIQGNNISAATNVIVAQDTPLFEYLSTLEGDFDAGMHGMLELYGLAKRHRRRPYHTMTDDELDKLKEFLIAKDLLKA